MKIEFKSIRISNFMSIGDADIELLDKGFTLVSGINNNPNDLARSNGSGKSTIFEAIVWCLTGKTMRGNLNIVNKYGSDGALVLLHFDVDNHSYVVMRTKEHSKYKTNLKIAIDGEDKSGKGIRDSEKLLSEYLPDLTPSLIGSVIILGQGLPLRFSNNSPSGRKEILETLCKSDFMIGDLKSRIIERKIDLQSCLREIEDKILSCSTEYKLCREMMDTDNQLLASLTSDNNYDDKIDELSCLIKNLEFLMGDLESKYKLLNDELNKSYDIQLQIRDNKDNELLEKSKEYTHRIDSLSNKRNDLNVRKLALSKELSRIQSISDVCPTCKQKLPDVHKPDTSEIEMELSDITNQLLLVNQEYGALVDEYDNIKLEIHNKYAQEELKISEDISKIREELNSISLDKQRITSDLYDKQQSFTKIMTERDSLSKNIQECEARIKEYSNRCKVLGEDILYNNNVKEDIEARLQIISKFDTIVKRDFRGHLLQGVIEFINERAKEYANDIFGTKLINFSLEGNSISISYNDKQYEALSGGERQKVDIIIQFSIRDMLCNYVDFSTNILVLDEIFDNLDDIGSQKIIDLISRRLSDVSSVYIISHHGNELNLPYDNELVIIKDENGVSSIK